MLTRRRTSVRLYLPLLAVSLMLLLALLEAPSSTADMMPGLMTFESTQPAGLDDMEIAGKVLEERLSSSLKANDGLAVAASEETLTISLPTDAEPSMVIAEASRTGRVELVDGGTEFLPLNRMIRTGPRANPDRNVYQAVLTSSDFEAAHARLTGDGRPVIEFVLTPAGNARLAAHTGDLRGYYFCLAVDNRVENCPVLRTPLTNRRGTIELTGPVTLDDARTLAMLIRSGPLPVSLKLASD